MNTETNLPNGVRRLDCTPFLIGDPASIIPAKHWDAFFRQAFGFGYANENQNGQSESLPYFKMSRGAVTWKGATLLILSTGGDGIFWGVPVDTGTLAVIHESDFSTLQNS